MGIRLEKAWTDLNAEAIASLPAQLGVYQVADSQGTVLSVGFAGARHLFGMRTALQEELNLHGDQATKFRFEFTSNYRSRWDELLMLHLYALSLIHISEPTRPY